MSSRRDRKTSGFIICEVDHGCFVALPKNKRRFTHLPTSTFRRPTAHSSQRHDTSRVLTVSGFLAKVLPRRGVPLVPVSANPQDFPAANRGKDC